MPQTIAVVSEIDPSGGGSHQWALNIFHALNDYRLARGDVSVVVIHFGQNRTAIRWRFSFLTSVMSRLGLLVTFSPASCGGSPLRVPIFCL